MLIHEFDEDGTAILQLSGRLDSTTAAEAGVKLSAVVGASRAVVVDLSELAYISSAGLRILLQGAKQAQAAKCAFAIAGLQPSVKEIFRSSGLHTIFSIHASRADALGKAG